MSKINRLACIRNTPCLACKMIPSDVAHIKTRGSHGSDEDHNVIPLCRNCHMNQHRWGFEKFLSQYPDVKKYLLKTGWEISNLHGRFRLTHPLECG